MFSYDYYPVYYIISVVKGLYVVVSAFLTWKNNQKADSMHRFHVLEVVITIVLIPVVFLITGIRIGPLCFSAALVFMFFSMTERWQYDDEEAGFYNKAYHTYMKELVREGRKDYRSVITLKCDGDDSALAAVIRRELPRGVERVHVKRGMYELYAENGADDLMELICEVIENAVSEYDKEHFDTPLGLVMSKEVRKKNEDAHAFLERIGV